MLGDWGCRIALQVLGYAWPAYKCYKEMGSVRAEGADRGVDTLLKWCKFWVIMGLFTAVAPFADTFIFWLPLYYEAKLALPIYLWWNNLAGAENVYRLYLQPFIAQREPVLDDRIASLRTQAGELCSSGMKQFWRVAQDKLLAVLLALQQGQAQGGGGAGNGGAAAPSPLRERNAGEDENLGRRSSSSSFSLDRFYSAKSGNLKAFPVNADGKVE